MQLDQRNYPTALVPKVTPELEAARGQVDRLLASNTFHASDVLRRLLRFLADKTFCGEAEDLKEYSVGLDALGKPPSYDPRQDAAVRLQASRLRQKLDDYYRNEGRRDPLVVEIPKGRFKIAWHPNDTLQSAAAPVATVVVSPPAIASPPVDAGESANLKTWRNLTIGFAIVSVGLAFVAVWSLSRNSRTLVASPAIAGSTPELDALWSPFLSSAHHMIIAFSNPLFVGFIRKGSPDIIYRRRGTRGWDDAVSSPEFSILSRSLGNPAATPNFNLVERSNLVSTFVLSQFFARRRADITLARAGDLSLQQFADNDVIVVAPSFSDKTRMALPANTEFVADEAGIRNLHPLAGEPQLYADPPDHQQSDGEALELISVLPGPMGRTTVMGFSGNHAWGVIGSVQSLTYPAFARTLVKKLRASSGEIPSYYQIVIKIRYRDGTPTEASYVTHRVLNPTENSSDTTDAN
jgi:hypothetical protein